MPQVRDLKAGQHFISNSGGEIFEVLCPGKDYAFVRKVSDGEESMFAYSSSLVSLASDSQVQQEGKIAMIRDIFEGAATVRQASEQILDYLQSERISMPSIIQEVSATYVKRCTKQVIEQDDSLIDGINALAGAAMAIAGSDSPNYQQKAARCWPWEHPTIKNETPSRKFDRVFRTERGEMKTFRDRLVWAAVLIIAEIEKQDRKAAAKNGK